MQLPVDRVVTKEASILCTFDSILLNALKHFLIIRIKMKYKHRIEAYTNECLQTWHWNLLIVPFVVVITWSTGIIDSALNDLDRWHRAAGGGLLSHRSWLSYSTCSGATSCLFISEKQCLLAKSRRSGTWSHRNHQLCHNVAKFHRVYCYSLVAVEIFSGHIS